VSGSYLFKSDYLGAAMLHLKGDTFESEYRIRDFMLTNGEAPILKENELDFLKILHTIEQYNTGFVMIQNNDNQLIGIITNADIRRTLIRNIDNLNDIPIHEMINATPFSLQENYTVNEMLQHIKAQRFPINYAPVVDEKNCVKGAVTFFNLIKGE